MPDDGMLALIKAARVVAAYDQAPGIAEKRVPSRHIAALLAALTAIPAEDDGQRCATCARWQPLDDKPGFGECDAFPLLLDAMHRGPKAADHCCAAFKPREQMTPAPKRDKPLILILTLQDLLLLLAGCLMGLLIWVTRWGQLWQ